MINTLIERDLWTMVMRKEAMDNINPILNKLVDAVHTHAHTSYPEDLDKLVDMEQIIREYIEVDVYYWYAMIVMNVLPSTNKALFDSFKSIMTECGVKEYTKDNDAYSKKRKLSGDFKLFEYQSFRESYDSHYKVDVMFRGDLPDTCRIEYEESYAEVDPDKFIVQKSGKVMRKEITTKVICDEQSILRLPQSVNA